MPTRRAFARPGLLLALLSGVGAATLLLTAEPVQAPARRPPAVIAHTPPFSYADPLTEPRPCPRYNIPLADGRKVNLADLRPGMALEDGCELQGAAWSEVNLAGVSLRRCNL